MTTAREKELLNDVQVEEALTELEGWEYKQKRLVKQFTFKNFAEAMETVNAVANLAEKHNHHPDILIYYTKVKFQLWTHRYECVSGADVDLARQIDSIAFG